MAREMCDYEDTDTRIGYVATGICIYNETCRIRRDEMTDGSFGYGVDFTCGPARVRFDCISEQHALDLAEELENVSSADAYEVL